MISFSGWESANRLSVNERAAQRSGGLGFVGAGDLGVGVGVGLRVGVGVGQRVGAGRICAGAVADAGVRFAAAGVVARSNTLRCASERSGGAFEKATLVRSLLKLEILR